MKRTRNAARARFTGPRIAIVWAVLVAPGVVLAQTGDEVLQHARAAEDAGDLVTARRELSALTGSAERRLAGQALFVLADVDEREFHFGDALAHYRASVETDSGGRYAARALARIDYLRDHAEGDFAPLAALERLRTDPRRASDPAAVAALARACESFPPGPVRAESRLLVGQAYAGRLHRPRDAAPVLRSLAQDRAASTELRQLAVELLAHVREDSGDYDTSLVELRELDAPASMIARVATLIRRRMLYKLSWLLVGAVGLAGIVAIAQCLRTGRGRELARGWLRPLPLAHLGMLSIGGALLARAHEDHSVKPFVAFGAGALWIYLTATAWSIAGSDRALARVVRATACAFGVLAVSFLAMHVFDQDMLAGIGL